MRWREIQKKGFPNFYISENGDVVNLNTMRELKTSLDCGYKKACLCYDNKVTKISIIHQIGKLFLDVMDNEIAVPLDGDAMNSKINNIYIKTKHEVRGHSNPLGVYRIGKKFASNIYLKKSKIKRQRLYLGVFKTEKEAVRIRDKALDNKYEFDGDVLNFRDFLKSESNNYKDFQNQLIC